MRISFHGRLADAFGRDIEIAIAGDCSIAELRERLALEHADAGPALGQRVKACVGDTIVADSHIVRPGDRVEFLPPVSGG